MVLQGGNVIVGDGQRVGSPNQKVVVHALVFVVMYASRPVGSQQLNARHGSAGDHTSMSQDHMCHLRHGRHMDAAEQNSDVMLAASWVRMLGTAHCRV